MNHGLILDLFRQNLSGTEKRKKTKQGTRLQVLSWKNYRNMLSQKQTNKTKNKKQKKSCSFVFTFYFQ